MTNRSDVAEFFSETWLDINYIKAPCKVMSLRLGRSERRIRELASNPIGPKWDEFQGCPLPHLDQVRAEASEFYSVQKRDEPRPSPWGEQYPSLFDLKSPEDGGKSEMNIDGVLWVRLPPPPQIWTLAQDDANYGLPATESWRPTPRHLHTSLMCAGYIVHIDFVRFMSWGPLSGTEEYVFFVDGVFKSRGGCYVHVPATFHRAWPPCVRFGQFAVVMRGCIRGDEPLDQIDELTLWHIDGPIPAKTS